jgi:hypothetical protein
VGIEGCIALVIVAIALLVLVLWQAIQRDRQRKRGDD